MKFVLPEAAKDLKALGFDEPCFGRWIRGEFADYKCESQHPHPETALAPTHQEAVDWFREKHGLFVFVDTTIDFDCYTPTICKKGELGHIRVSGTLEYSDYYAAYNAAIDEAIKLVTK